MQISEMIQIDPINDDMVINKGEQKGQHDFTVKSGEKINPDDINFLSVLFGLSKDTDFKINLFNGDGHEDKKDQNNTINKTGDTGQENPDIDAILNKLNGGGEIPLNGIINTKSGETKVIMDTGGLKINIEDLLKGGLEITQEDLPTSIDTQAINQIATNSTEIAGSVNDIDKEMKPDDNGIEIKDIDTNSIFLSNGLDELKKDILKPGFDLQQNTRASGSGDKAMDNANDSKLNLNNAGQNMENGKEKTVEIPDEFNGVNRGISETDFNVFRDQTTKQRVLDGNSYSKSDKLQINGSKQNTAIPDLKNSNVSKPDEKTGSAYILPGDPVIKGGGHVRKQIEGAVKPDPKNTLFPLKQNGYVKNHGNILFNDPPDEKAGLNRENISYPLNPKISQGENVSENLKKGVQVINISGSKHIKNSGKGGEHNTGKNGLSLLNAKESLGISDPVVGAKGTDSGQKIVHTHIVNQIADKMAFSLKNGLSKVKVSLKPESLGHLRLEISSNDHKIDVKIMTQSAVVKDLIEHHIQHLRTGLEGHGLAMDKVDVFVSSDSSQYREKDEGYHSFGSGNPDHDETIAGDNRSVESLPEPVWPGRMGTGENSVDYFA